MYANKQNEKMNELPFLKFILVCYGFVSDNLKKSILRTCSLYLDQNLRIFEAFRLEKERLFIGKKKYK